MDRFTSQPIVCVKGGELRATKVLNLHGCWGIAGRHICRPGFHGQFWPSMDLYIVGQFQHHYQVVGIT